MNTVTIKQVMQPAQGRKMGKLCVEHNGQDVWLACWPDKLAGISQGMVIDLEWQQESFQGRDGNTVTNNKLTKVGKVTGQSAPRSGETHAKPSGQAKEIFVTGVVGRAAGSGVIKTPDQIMAWTANARVAWETVMEAEEIQIGNKPKPESGVGSDLDDDLPF